MIVGFGYKGVEWDMNDGCLGLVVVSKRGVMFDDHREWDIHEIEMPLWKHLKRYFY